MEHVGMDLGKQESPIAIITEDSELIEKRMRTERERVRVFFAYLPQARILMEASTISERVAKLSEATRSPWPIPTTRRCMRSGAGE